MKSITALVVLGLLLFACKLCSFSATIIVRSPTEPQSREVDVCPRLHQAVP